MRYRCGRRAGELNLGALASPGWLARKMTPDKPVDLAIRSVLLRWQARARLCRASYQRDVAVELVRALLAPGDELVDVGAAMGAVVDAGLASRAHVTAVEPNPAWAERLGAYPASMVDVRALAVDAQRARKDLHVPLRPSGEPNHFQASLREGANAGSLLQRTTVATVPLDELVERVTVLKIDVEGAEREVLESGRSILERQRPAIVVEIEQRHHPSEPAERSFELLAELGYEGFFPAVDGSRSLWAIDGFRFDRHQRPELLRPGARRFDRRYVNNFLFVHSSKREAAARRLRRRGWTIDTGADPCAG